MKKFQVPPRTLPPVCDLIDGIGSEGKRRLPRLHPSNFEPTTPGRIYKPASTPNNAHKLDSKGNKVSSNQRLIFFSYSCFINSYYFYFIVYKYSKYKSCIRAYVYYPDIYK